MSGEFTICTSPIIHLGVRRLNGIILWRLFNVLDFVDIHRELLFREIYDKFSEDPIGKIVFLESLEPHILSDK